MKYNNIIFLGLCLGLTTYSALSADSVIKIDSIFLAFFLNQFLTLGYIMGKTISIKVLFGIYLLLMAGKVFAFSCNVDGGSSIGAGTTSVYVNLDPVIQPGQNLVVDLSQHISCWNDYGGWYDTDHINLVQGSAFAGSYSHIKDRCTGIM